jgi:hypothetical protein
VWINPSLLSLFMTLYGWIYELSEVREKSLKAIDVNPEFMYLENLLEKSIFFSHPETYFVIIVY